MFHLLNLSTGIKLLDHSGRRFLQLDIKNCLNQLNIRSYSNFISSRVPTKSFNYQTKPNFIGFARRGSACAEIVNSNLRKRSVYVSSSVFTSTMPAAATNGSSGNSQFKRLPKNVIPSNYDLTFEPDWASHRYEASAIIDVDVKEETDVIVLNAANFSVSEITYKADNDGSILEPEVFLLDLELEILKINFAKALARGPGKLCITYSGIVADNMKGLFRSKYRGPNGEDRYHYLTKFEPTMARTCFPSWDEPNIKTTYDITLIVPKHLVAVSNMPVKEDVPHATNVDKKVVKFERSVKMSTYVMAFAMGEFDYVEKRTSDGILCRVYTPVGKKERGNFALDVCIKSLAFYKDYFGIPYPLPKMDLLGVAEFGSGAMENWGLVIFREPNLLLDDNLSSALTKQYVSIVVAHEIAHMWFGNLVTMLWWNDLWLNEGFASWIEFYCVDRIYPELEIWNIFMEQLIEALKLDSSSTSHPIQASVEDPAQIGSIFDYISYVKGAAVIRMLHDYLGSEKFRVGLSHYLKSHLFGNAETKDLWDALTEKSSEQVDVLMSTFTEQMGYPIVSLKNIQQSGDQKILTLSYEKFWADETAKGTDEKVYKWIIPITVRKQSDPAGVALRTLVNEEPNTDFTVTVDSKENEWIKINADHVGYFLTSYPPAILENFVIAIKSKELQPLDRAGILNELFSNVMAGHSTSSDALKLMLAYEKEDVVAVWSVIGNIIEAMGNLLIDTPLKEKFQAYARKLVTPTAERLGWDPKENETPQDSVLRSTIVSKIIGLECENALEEARNRFSQQTRGEKDISPDVRSAVYRAVALQGESGFDNLLKIYRKTDLLEEKMRILAALGQVNDKAVIQKILEFGRSSEVNKQDIITILVSMCQKGKRDIAWEFFKQNWEFFRDNFQTGHFLIRRLVTNVTEGFKTEEKAVEIEQFFKDHQIKGIERTLTQALENIRVNKAWLERDSSNLQQFLSSN